MLYLFISFTLLTSHFSSAQNMGYTFKNGYCQKNRAAGYNPNLMGECGMFTGARILNQKLEDKKLTAVNLNGSFISRSLFTKVDLNNAAFRSGVITESHFTDVEAKLIDFRGTWIKGSTWTNSNLYSWIATGARIEKTSFINCNLQYANFWGSNLQESDFSGSDLRWANFESTFTLFTKFTGAKFNSKTLLPFSEEEALKRGMIKVD